MINGCGKATAVSEMQFWVNDQGEVFHFHGEVDYIDPLVWLLPCYQME